MRPPVSLHGPCSKENSREKPWIILNLDLIATGIGKLMVILGLREGKGQLADFSCMVTMVVWRPLFKEL